MSWTEQETAEYFYRETLVDAGVPLDKIKPLEDSDEALNNYQESFANVLEDPFDYVFVKNKIREIFLKDENVKWIEFKK